MARLSASPAPSFPGIQDFQCEIKSFYLLMINLIIVKFDKDSNITM